MRVAVPPMLEAMIWVMKKGTGLVFSMLVMARVMGPMRSTVVTLSKNPESTAVMITQQEHQGPGPALGDLGCLDGNVFKDAGVLDDRYEKHHTDENADGIDVHIGEAGLHRENACENEQ